METSLFPLQPLPPGGKGSPYYTTSTTPFPPTHILIVFSNDKPHRLTTLPHLCLIELYCAAAGPISSITRAPFCQNLNLLIYADHGVIGFEAQAFPIVDMIDKTDREKRDKSRPYESTTRTSLSLLRHRNSPHRSKFPLLKLYLQLSTANKASHSAASCPLGAPPVCSSTSIVPALISATPLGLRCPYWSHVAPPTHCSGDIAALVTTSRASRVHDQSPGGSTPRRFWLYRLDRTGPKQRARRKNEREENVSHVSWKKKVDNDIWVSSAIMDKGLKCKLYCWS